MGRLLESLAPAHQCAVSGIVSGRSPREIEDAADADVAVDFSHGAAVRATVEALGKRGLNVVIGTTGWQADNAAVHDAATRAGIGVLAAANFSVGLFILRSAVETAAAKFAALPDVGAFIHEAHHAAKKDAPSGTALVLKAAMERAGYDRAIDVSSTRAGSLPGRHTVGFDAPAETVTLTHDVRDRAVFAHGALEAAKWLKGKHGWFTLADMLG
jgi:4-hydroxy-tetrahydrodipicolinate reductase